MGPSMKGGTHFLLPGTAYLRRACQSRYIFHCLKISSNVKSSPYHKIEDVSSVPSCSKSDSRKSSGRFAPMACSKAETASGVVPGFKRKQPGGVFFSCQSAMRFQEVARVIALLRRTTKLSSRGRLQ